MEKTMKRSNLDKKISECMKEIRDWKRQDHSRTASLMIDTDDGAIWTDVFLDENSWKEYRSSTIQNIFGWNSVKGRQILNADVAQTARELLTEDGWEIE